MSSTLAVALFLALAQAEAPAASAAPEAVPAAQPEAAPAAAAAAAEPEAEAPKAVKLGANQITEEASAPKGTTADARPWYLRFDPFGYARVGVYYTLPFREDQLVGGNGGFRLANMRLGIEFHPIGDLTVVASLEGGAPLRNELDPTTGIRIVELRDAYLEYRLARFFQVRAGQFKAPFNGETLLPDAVQPFISRSVVTSGAFAPEAYGPRNGLTLDRQLGLQLFSTRLGGEGFNFRYAVGVFNGNGQNQLFNDNNAVAPAGRVELGFAGNVVNVGLNGYYNARTEGVRPNRIGVGEAGFGGDVALHVAGITALAMFVGRNVTYLAPGLPGELGYGAVGSLHWYHEGSGLELGARYAYYEPSTAQVDDVVNEISGMVGFRLSAVPLRAVLQYTYRGEEPAVALENHSVDLMVQATW